jgi:hypothetical protein
VIGISEAGHHKTSALTSASHPLPVLLQTEKKILGMADAVSFDNIR